MSAQALGLARTFLFVPADRPERHARALASGAGAVIVDFEDAVAPERKAAAREALPGGFAALPAADRARLLLRINAPGTPWHADDLALVARLAAARAIAGVVLPKTESADQLARLAEAAGPEAVLVPLIESAAGLAALDAIAAAPQVLRLAFGHLDFQADLGMACDAQEAELVPVRLALVLASRRANLAAPIDGIATDWRDAERLAAEAARARRGGFGAKLCIHPAQVAPVHAALGPGAEELAWARRVVEAVAQAGGGVVNLDGRMVDAPVVRLAQRLLALDAQAPPH
ncbi:citryl-CoA lyase [Variovorax paradoxus]|jgi:citrate lyase subunit beta/citryl-CoA lyase|uniref:HpcH/HpaI aldolase/citrate lyase family protein n=1 Tax=Variovorax paradoxus TaxID=34073 RepID=UPI0006E4E9EF|nr:citryl-CoA lyase [Variovorax paradoxus]KPV02172.1 citryl-CoA lyase [Variovorax paradoxus]KPV05136.1 citryl-CoA lyase [Variovorax paradoxus]KPV15051.1 citryl-CoA lyase [Variovorax paradoxus]KPV17643.1 citryl-CoA lyase [Variovorax paradoxus]